MSFKRSLNQLVYLAKFYSNRILRRINKANRHRHQLTSTTGYDRYPEIFRESQMMHSKAKEKIKIMSYGCSFGHECISLKKYFPAAGIFGFEISFFNLLYARIINRNKNIKYFKSNNNQIIRQGKFDIIFALSVLCRWEDSMGLQDISGLYPFSQFENTIELFDSVLNENGLLIIYNSNFRLSDTRYSEKFEPVNSQLIKESGFVSKFNNKNKLDDKPYPFVIFKKKVNVN